MLFSVQQTGHFSAAFVDEAGHGWEPEVIAAFSALLHLEIPARRGATLTAGATAAGINNAQLVLAGDPQQLGPIVRSDAVNDDHGGLSISLLERLILSHPAYQRDPAAYPGRLVGYDPRCLTMLRKCYRCHPDILRIPNELFYNNALEAAADPVVTHNLVTWTGLPQQGFPMLFHGVEGENMREANSPSWFNIAEIEVVFKYVRDLVDIARVPAREIAVITPYHKQVTKVLQLLRNKNAYGERYAEVTVGSCEKMQGQERRVVIISTVRSSPEFLEHDKYFNLGFVASPKRFNVAVTRAKALVVVVGNPHVLVADPNWGALLRFCLERGGYTGCSPPEIPAADAGGPDDPTGDANGNISEGEQGESIGASWDHVDSLSAQLSGLGVHPAVAPAPATPSARSGSLLGDGAEDSWVEVDAAEADWSGLEH